MKLTSEMLKRIIEEEVSKSKSKSKSRGKKSKSKSDSLDVKAKEVDADSYGKSENLENHVNYAAALKLEHTRLVKRLKKISEERARLKQIISSSI
jgi:hypothetical protein